MGYYSTDHDNVSIARGPCLGPPMTVVARVPAPRLCGWLSNDPIGISGGLNQYAAMHNNAVNYCDPWGLADIVLLPDPAKIAGLTDKQIGEFAAAQAFQIPDEITLVMHGAGGKILDQRSGTAILVEIDALATDIKGLGKYTPGTRVRIIGCEAAEGDLESAAQKLAEALGTNPVLATKVRSRIDTRTMTVPGPMGTGGRGSTAVSYTLYPPQGSSRWIEFPRPQQ